MDFDYEARNEIVIPPSECPLPRPRLLSRPIAGYPVLAEVEAEIFNCLKGVLLVDPKMGKVLPVSRYDRAKDAPINFCRME